MGYRSHAKETSFPLRTGIHTKISNNLRISSSYRRFANQHFESWAWETFLWEGERIIDEYDTLMSADQVIDLHTEILKKHTA